MQESGEELVRHLGPSHIVAAGAERRSMAHWRAAAKHGKAAAMTSDPHPPHGARPANPVGIGAPIAFLILGGVIVGGLLGQPSIGFLVGVGLGLLLALVTWRMAKRK
jgi:hypothetical protein